MTWDKYNLGGSLTGPFRYWGWCLYTGQRQTLRDETKEWTPFLRAVELLYVHQHWPPSRCHLLQAALAARETKPRPLQERRAPRRMRKRVAVRALFRYPLSLRVPRRDVTGWTTCGASPAKGNAKMTLEGMASTEQPLAPSASRNSVTISARLQHLKTARRLMPLVPQSCRSLGRRSYAKKKLGGTSPGLTPAVLRSDFHPLRCPTSWLWIEADPRAGNRSGRVGPLEPAGSTLETHLQWKTYSGTRTSAPTPSRPGRIVPRNSLNPVCVLRASVIGRRVVIMTLFPHVTDGHAKNIAAASCELAAGDNVIDVNSMYPYSQCDPGPDTSEVNHPCFVVSMIVWACAAPISEELTSVSHRFHVSRRPSTIRGTARHILIRRGDPLCTADLKGNRRLNPLCTTELKGEIPVRRLNPFCTAELKGEVGGPLAICFDRKSGILCSEQAISRRIKMTVNLPKAREKKRPTRMR